MNAMQNFRTSMLMPGSEADGVCTMSCPHGWDTRDDLSDVNYPRTRARVGKRGQVSGIFKPFSALGTALGRPGRLGQGCSRNAH